MDWMFLTIQNSYVEILISNMMVFGGKAFERQLGHEGGALMNEISALKTDMRESTDSFCSLACEDTTRR
jgi:hypothetical protein